MHDVIKWIEATALAASGLNEEQVDAVVKARELPAFAEAAVGENKAAHFRALRELRQNFKSLQSEGTLQEVLTTSHFATYFTDALSRAFYADYNYQGFDWAKFITNDDTPDFRAVKRFRMTEPDDLVRRGEKAHLKGTNVEAGTPVSLAVDEYARFFDVSWRTIMNDDLGKIRETPQRMAKAARRWLDKFVSRLYDNATSQAGLTALGASWAGTGKLTVPNLTIGINAMKTRADEKGYKLDITKIYLVIPSVSEVTQSEILADIIAYGGTDSNTLSRFLAGVVTDPHMTVSGGNVPWYLIAAPADVPTVTLLRLRGWGGPVVFQKTSDLRAIAGGAPAAFGMGDFASGNIQFAVEDVVGGRNDATYGGLTDYRGIYWSNGSTS